MTKLLATSAFFIKLPSAGGVSISIKSYWPIHEEIPFFNKSEGTSVLSTLDK